MTRDLKIGFLMGWGEAAAATTEKSIQEKFSSQPNYGEYQTGIDALCAAPQNAIIPVWEMIGVFTLKSQGVSEKDITFRLEFDKKYFSQPPSDVPPAPTKTGGKKQ